MKKKVKGRVADRHILIKQPSKIGVDQAVGWEYSANSDSFGWKNVCSVLCLQIVIYRLSSHIIQRLLTNGSNHFLSFDFRESVLFEKIGINFFHKTENNQIFYRGIVWGSH